MRPYLFAAAILFFTACANNPAPKATQQNNPVEEKPSFFPVTSYLKGQIFEIKEKGLAPIKYTTINHHTDSAYIKLEELDELLKEFLHPQIDTANMAPFFTESKFLDQTINAVTFTYDSKVILPDSLLFNHWDVYVDPETNKVKRIYMVKKSNSNTMLQLTWQSNQWCKILTIVNSKDGASKIEKEEKFSWDY